MYNWPNTGYYPDIYWRDWVQSRHTSVKIACLCAYILTRKLPNTKQVCETSAPPPLSVHYLCKNLHVYVILNILTQSLYQVYKMNA
jgi:hypothetical protein